MVSGVNALDTIEITDLIKLTAIIAIAATLWILTARHHRWARLCLIALAAIGAIGDLASANNQGALTSISLLIASISVLSLWAISSEAIQEWVSPRTEQESTNKNQTSYT